MQAEIDADPASRPIQILGLNDIGLESGNDGMIAGQTLPWLQPETGEEIWTLWAVEYRDVIIIDPDNEYVGTFNLTINNLADTTNYATLMTMLRDAANE